VPFQNFETADGWIVVACPKEKFWALLCDAIERPALSRESRYATFADRDRNRDELEPILGDIFRQRTSDEWLAVLGKAGVPCAPVNDIPAALDEARLVEYQHPRLGTVRQIASPLRLSGPEPPARPAPARGEHTEQVLAEVCGYGPGRIRALAESGVFGVESKGERGAETGVAT
jgi:crotonobetainyl-CoA:carnitine CoA-transferase CaiB-like acyl-CoA transferase